MDKVAILNIRNMSKSSGGPSGYLYNLYLGYERIPTLVAPDFIYLVENETTSTNTSISGYATFKSRFPNIREILYYVKEGIKFRRKIKHRIKNYSYFHVHTGEAVVYLRKFCSYKGKIIFTPHRPETVKNEKVSILRNKKSGSYKIAGAFFDFTERLSYKCADAFIFPCKDAQSIYTQFPGFIKYSIGKPIEYVYTGIDYKEPSISSGSYREKLRIPGDAFVVGYIGRHNNIKGYDRLIGISNDLYKQNIYVLVGGSYNESAVPKLPTWKEMGFVNDAENLINACDIIAVPNRNTYFDLVVLEALSHGKPVISSNTGGNISIAEETKAILLFDNKEDKDGLLKLIYEYEKLKDEDKELLCKEAKEFYEKECTCSMFAQNYATALQRIIALI